MAWVKETRHNPIVDVSLGFIGDWDAVALKWDEITARWAGAWTKEVKSASAWTKET